MDQVLKKIGLVAVATIGLSLAATPAFATPATPDNHGSATAPREVAPGTEPTFGDAYNQFIIGGGALGYGAASLVAGAYTGIALTPALIAHSFSCGGGCE
jgi:hypothetical protein